MFFGIAIISLIVAWFIIFSSSNSTEQKTADKKKFNFFGGKKTTLNIISKTGTGSGFFEEACTEFMAKNPNIDIVFKGLGTFEAIDYINKDNDVDAWICADETGAAMLKEQYSKEHQGKNIIEDSAPIVVTPLVLVGWDERLSKLSPNFENISISMLYDIVATGKTWQSLGGDPNWGFVKFSHTDPIKSNSGVQFITLLIQNFYERNNTSKKEIRVQDIADEKIVEFVKEFESNTAKQEEGSGKFMDSIILYGPSRYDIGANYEFYVLSNLKNAKGRWGKLRIIYPNPTIWSNRPFVILNGPKATKEKLEACKKFKEYLLSANVQQKAMQEGYRPANTAVSDISYLEKEYSQYGFKRIPPPDVPAPTPDVVQSIQAMIQRIRNQ